MSGLARFDTVCYWWFMLIAIDIGNTSTTIGVYDGDRLAGSWRITTDKTADCKKLWAEFSGGDKNRFLLRPGGAIISSVVPEIDHVYTEMFKENFGFDPVFVDYKNAGIKIECEDPSTLGADRLVNAVAAYEKYKSAVIAIDFGTATTFDYTDGGGVFRGGPIAPGIALLNEALCSRASKLPEIDIKRCEKVMGKNTVEVVQAGVYQGYVGLTQRLLKKMGEEVGTSPKVIATGGFAGLICRDLADIEVDRFLTLTGLKLIYDRLLKSFATTG